jgi:hypothetical protein
VRRSVFFLCCGLLISGCQQSDVGGDLDISIPVSVQEVKNGPIEEFITTTATVNAIKNTVLYSAIEGTYRLDISQRE